MIKALKNLRLFQKKEDARDPDSSATNLENPKSKKKILNPHADDMCCGSCGGNKAKKK